MKWGILATGTIAHKFAATVQQMSAEGESLAAVGSRRADSARAFAQQYGIPRWYGSYEQLAADPEVEAVYVATPNSLHFDNCRLCLEHGKHVLCEKPFTLTPQQAETLYYMAEEKGLFLMEAFWIWFLPLYAHLRQLLASGTLGQLREITCQYGFVAAGARRERKFNSSLGGGALLDIGIYNLGFLQLVTGQQPSAFRTQQLHLSEYGTDDFSRLELEYPCGCRAQSVQAIGQELVRNARIVGTKGSVFLPDFQHAQQMVLELNGQAPRTLDFPEEINGFEYQIRESSRCVRAGRWCSDIYSPAHSLALTQLLYAIRSSWGMRFAGEE
ncbi:MAG: Gfo/Idh/MocA family protein [Faecalibacterium sp.]